MFAVAILSISAIIIVYHNSLPVPSQPKPQIDMSEIPRLVMAFYHNWYGNTTGETGEWLHWNSPLVNTTSTWSWDSSDIIKTYDPEEFVSPDRRDVASIHYPVLGAYDNRDPELMRQHIKWALEAGINVFIIDWWGDHFGTQYTDISMEMMMDLNEEENLGMKFCILVDGRGGTNLEWTVRRLEYAITKYGGRSSYLKLQGFPVFFFYATKNIHTLEDWKSIVDRVRLDGYHALFFCDSFSEEYAEVFDGFQNYSPFFRNLVNNYNIYNFIADLARQYNLTCGLAAIPGFDNTMVFQPGETLARDAGSIYNATWEAIFSSGCNWALVCSWNEWHEGTEIEPSLEYGDYYLELTRYFSYHFKQGSNPFHE